MAGIKVLKTLFAEHGFTDFRWLDPKEIVVGQWVRMKCLYGCGEYGKTWTCPPHAPSIAECERFFHEYKRAAVFHFQKKVDKPEDRHAWSRKICRGLVDLEIAVFKAGYERAFVLLMDSCNFCLECGAAQAGCKEPRLSRPSPDALGMDVYSTVRKLGYPIKVLANYDETMNRYAFLLIE